MPTSQNGYTANDKTKVSSRLVPGTTRKLTVRNGAPGNLLIDFAAQFNRKIETIDAARGELDDWGYAERPIRGSTTELSNHASGTAIDLNSLLHPLGRRGSFSAVKAARIRHLLKAYDGCIRWGGDYRLRKDEMHFEIVKSSAACEATWAKLLKQRTRVPVQAPNGSLIKMQHSSLQFSDTPAQMKHDVEALFSRGRDVLTWTEAGFKEPLRKLIMEIGPKYGYTVHAHKWGCGVAVRNDYATSLRAGYEPAFGVAKATDPNKHYPRGIEWVQFLTRTNELISVGSVHYITGGRTKAQGYRYLRNVAYSKLIGGWAERQAVGNATAFVAGDMNIVDRVADVFFGQPLTTCWDELKKWPNTGHDNIDVIASYDGDNEVTCVGARVLNDESLNLFTDHFVVEADYLIARR